MLKSRPHGALTLWRRFLPYLGNVRGLVAVTGALVLLSPLIGAALLWLVRFLVDDVLIRGRLDSLPTFAALYIVVAAAKFSFDYASMRLEASIVERLIRDIRVDLYTRLISLSPGSLRQRSVGDLLAHLSGDVERTEDLIYGAPLKALADLVGVILFGGFLLLLSWKLTLLSLVAVPPIALVSRHYAAHVRHAAKITREQATRWLALAEERVGAAPLVQAFGTEADETARFAARCDANRGAELRTVAIQAWLSLLVEAAAFLGGMVVLAVGAYEIHRDGTTLGTLVAFLGSVGSLYDPIRGLARAPARFERAAAGGQRVLDLIDAPSLVTERPSARPLRHPQGAIEFRAVSFAYPGGAPALREISLRIEPGEMVAVVGPSGSGKSTLIRLLLRLYDPSSGAVLVDGTDIRDITLASLRRTVAAVFQEPFILRGSIRDNIRYGSADLSASAIAAAAVAAHVDGFARLLPGGYGGNAGPRGSNLSGGQRQRIALARALARGAPILVLDEATGSVDSETEELIHDAVDRLAGQRTILSVGHRLSSLQRADRVIVVEGGRIVESGTPKALLRRGSRYHDLFAAQVALGAPQA